MTIRCAYGRALVVRLTGTGAFPEGYAYVAFLDSPKFRLQSHDRSCRECSSADDSTNPDAAHMRRFPA